MLEKILGFEKKHATFFASGLITFEEKNLVPVNLKSKSIALKWLKNYCKENCKTENYGVFDTPYKTIEVDELILVASKQAKRR